MPGVRLSSLHILSYSRPQNPILIEISERESYESQVAANEPVCKPSSDFFTTR